MPDLRFQPRFCGPRYWGHGVLIALIWIARLFPRVVSAWLGAALGDLFRFSNSKRRAIARTNLNLCFPDINEQDREQMLVDHFRAYGQSIIDLGFLWWASPRRLERLFRVSGLEVWLDQANEGSKTLLITPHTVGIDMGGVYLSQYFPMVSMMKLTRNPLVNWLLWNGRRRFGAKIISRDEGIRSLVRSLLEGQAGYLIPDEDLLEARTVFGPFFGVETATSSVVGRLSRITGVKVFPMFTRRLHTGLYEIDIRPALENFPTGNETEDVRRINEVFEMGIRLAPEQYLWTLQWFKNRPEGAISPYS